MGLFDFTFSFNFGKKPDHSDAESARIEVGARRRDIEKIFGPPVSSQRAPGGGKTNIYAIAGQNLSANSGDDGTSAFGGVSLNVGMKEVTKITAQDGRETGSMRLSITYGPDDRITEIKPV